MEPDYEDDDVRVFAGDCLDVLRELPDASVDAVVTDPPYGIEFMGKEWDRPSYAGITTGNGSPHARQFSVNFTGAPNPTCRTCGGLRSLVTEGSGGRTKCRCERPDFPDYRGDTMRAYQAWCEAWARECLRVVKPGGHLLAFGGTRTYHRLACAVEDAGFEIRDSIDWIYAQGFPKSLDVGKAIDRHLGAEREVVAHRMVNGGIRNDGLSGGSPRLDSRAGREPTAVTTPATEQAEQWNGWGTALKPAHEPIVVARKPLAGTVAGNALEHGTGPLNIDGCRVAWGQDGDVSAARKAAGYTDAAKRALGTAVAAESTTGFSGEVIGTDSTAGRWPANVVLSHGPDCQPRGTQRVATTTHYPATRPGGGLGNDGHVGQDGLAERQPGTEVVEAWDCADGCPVRELDGQSGVRTSGAPPTRRRVDGVRGTFNAFAGQDTVEQARGASAGGASRFFPTFRYEAKATPLERPTADGVMHPTVKPVALMQWLVRLVVPRGATVLDPFLGSGTTAEACVIEGMRCVGIEREPTYLPLIRARLRKAITPTLGLDL